MIFLSTSLAIAWGAIVFSADTEDDWATKTQQGRVRALVEMLASKNAAPPDRKNWSGFPPDFNKHDQAVVYLAIQQLLREGSAAFDDLIANFENEQYSYTYDVGTGHFNLSVGHVCAQIMRRMIFCYEGEIDLITADQSFLVYPIEKYDEWWRKNGDRPLWKIQVEVIDEAIQFFETVNRKTARPITAKHPGPLPEERFEAGRKKNLRVLREIRTVILEREEAYVPKSLENHFGYGVVTGVPWPLRINSK